MFDENSNATAAASLTAVPAVPTPTNINSNHLVNQLLNAKDSRWLQLEVCREFQRGQCSRSDIDCKFAHPPAHVDVQNGRVTACYDSIKGRCTRENPKCKYLHPPQHLKDQLLVNGRNNLALKNLICSQLTQPGITNNIQMAQLLQQQQQPQQAALLPTMPYQYYSPLTAIYPTLMPADPFVQTNGVNGKNKNGVPTNGIPIYAQQTAQFNPYLMQQVPGYMPAVSFSQQLPPRF